MGTIASVHNFLMLQNFKTFCASPSTRFRQQQKLKNLFKFCAIRWVDRHESVSTFSNLQFTVVEALEEISAWPDRETSSRSSRCYHHVAIDNYAK